MSFEIRINEKLSIKMPTLEDAKDVFDVIDKNRDHLDEWLDWVKDTKSFKDTEDNIIERIEKFKNKESASFLISYEGVWVGSVGFIDINEKHKKGEIGYWLASDVGGKGIMTECVNAIIDYGFRDLDLHRIVIRCNSKNIKSIAIPKRLNFTFEGIIREDRLKDGVFSDTSIWGILKEEWEVKK